MKHYRGYSGSVGDLAICKSAGFVIGLLAGGTLNFALALPFAAIGYMAGNLFYSVIYIIKTIFIFLFEGVSDATEALSKGDPGRDRAENNNPESQFKLACRYLDGNGVPKDINQAVYWWRQAAERGHAMSQFNLAECYVCGTGVEKDLHQAAYWYGKAAELGYEPAQTALKSLVKSSFGKPSTVGE